MAWLAEVNSKHTSIVAENPLLLGAPVPHHDCAILGAGHYVAVLTYVTLGPRDARHDVVVAEYCLHHGTCQKHKHKGQGQFYMS